jgi:hypothetical protein
MLISSLILAASVVLFVYWFRYTCVLIIDAENSRQYAAKVAMANRLSFNEVQQRLEEGKVSLDLAYRSLDNDFRIISYLQQHAAGLAGESFEKKLLSLDYKMMQFWYRVSRSVAPSQARKALQEMTAILSFFAEQMGQRITQNSVA